ncbi:hypothetical protein BsWGS_10276 [Bradybaena similaris]
MPPKIPEKQMQELTDAFRIFDKNKDGSISCDELGEVLRSMGQNPTKADLNVMINEMDPNENGRIEFKEFVDAMCKIGINTREQEADKLRDAFRVFDSNGDGFIFANELRHAMTSMGEPLTDEEVDKMMDEADINGDGKVNYEEFVRMMTGP